MTQNTQFYREKQLGCISCSSMIKWDEEKKTISYKALQQSQDKNSDTQSIYSRQEDFHNGGMP